MVTQIVGVLFHVEAVSLTCDDDDDDDDTDVCPGTELTCTCSTSISNNTGLIWTLPAGSENIAFDDKADVGSNETTTNGIFFAVVTNNTGGVLESMLIYTATESLVNGTIVCSGNAGAGAMSTTINVTLAG